MGQINPGVGAAGGSGSDTQYTDGNSTPVHPIGTMPIFDNAGTITAVSAVHPLPTTASLSTSSLAINDGTTTTQKLAVDASGKIGINNFPATQPISGTVTANAGTNLNTSALALESGGNLATIATNTGNGATAANQTNGSQQTKVVPGTSGGLSSYTASITNSASQVKSSAGQVYGWYIYNNNSSQSYVQFYNTANSSITVGTTTPVYSIGIPANSGANVFTDIGIAHGTAINIAATTTRTGGTAPTNDLDVNVFYN